MKPGFLMIPDDDVGIGSGGDDSLLRIEVEDPRRRRARHGHETFGRHFAENKFCQLIENANNKRNFFHELLLPI
jgi:hypothetical protein